MEKSTVTKAQIDGIAYYLGNLFNDKFNIDTYRVPKNSNSTKYIISSSQNKDFSYEMDFASTNKPFNVQQPDQIINLEKMIDIITGDNQNSELSKHLDYNSQINFAIYHVISVLNNFIKLAENDKNAQKHLSKICDDFEQKAGITNSGNGEWKMLLIAGGLANIVKESAKKKNAKKDKILPIDIELFKNTLNTFEDLTNEAVTNMMPSELFEVVNADDYENNDTDAEKTYAKILTQLILTDKLPSGMTQLKTLNNMVVASYIRPDKSEMFIPLHNKKLYLNKHEQLSSKPEFSSSEPIIAPKYYEKKLLEDYKAIACPDKSLKEAEQDMYLSALKSSAREENQVDNAAKLIRILSDNDVDLLSLNFKDSKILASTLLNISIVDRFPFSAYVFATMKTLANKPLSEVAKALPEVFDDNYKFCKSSSRQTNQTLATFAELVAKTKSKDNGNNGQNTENDSPEM